MSNTDHWNRIISNHYRGSDYLMHHGTKGQKWGVRNYQNKDGTLTEAGKKRYGTRDVRIRTPERMQKDVVGKAVKFNPEGGGGGYYEVDEWEDENNKIESEISQLEKDLEDIENDLDAVDDGSVDRSLPGFKNRDAERRNLQERIQKMKDGLKRKRESEQAFLKDYVAKDETARKMKTSFRHTDVFNDVLMAYYDNSYLSHHGILGQKWGVRRFQNKDGTRTLLGKRQRDRVKSAQQTLTKQDVRTLRNDKDLLNPSDATVKVIAKYYDLDREKDRISSAVDDWEQVTQEFINKKKELQAKGIDDPEFRKLFDKATKNYLGDQFDSDELKELIEMEMKDGIYDGQVMDWITWTYYQDGSKVDDNYLERNDRAHKNYYDGIDGLVKGLIQERGSDPLDIMDDEFGKGYKKETGREYEATSKHKEYMLRSIMLNYCKSKH